MIQAIRQSQLLESIGAHNGAAAFHSITKRQEAGTWEAKQVS
jgi:hypothetical protein